MSSHRQCWRWGALCLITAGVLTAPLSVCAQASVAASKRVEILTDADGDGKVSPGDRLRYIVVITNAGPESAQGVEFMDPMDSARMTVDPLSINVSPQARGDAYGVVGNTRLDVPSSNGVTNNDVDVDGHPFSISTYDSLSEGGGEVELRPDGSFTYFPSAGFVGEDRFTYTLRDEKGGEGIGVVRLQVSNLIWYVDNRAGPGDGRAEHPFNSLEPLRGPGDVDGPGDTIYVRAGNGVYPGGLALEPAQRLVGEGAQLRVAGEVLAEAGSPPVIASSGSPALELAYANIVQGLNIVVTNGTGVSGADAGPADIAIDQVRAVGGAAVDVTAGSGARFAFGTLHSMGSPARGVFVASHTGGWFSVTGTVSVANADGDGFTIRDAPGSTNHFGSIEITSVAIDATAMVLRNGGAIRCTGGSIHAGPGQGILARDVALDLVLSELTSTGGSAPGIEFRDVDGSFVITGDGGVDPNGSGGTISGKSGPGTGVDGIFLENAENVSLGYMTISGNSRNGICGENLRGFVLRHCTLRDNADQVLPAEAGLHLVNVTGTAESGSHPTVIDGVIVADSFAANALLRNDGGVLSSLVIRNSSFSNRGLSGQAEHNLEVAGSGDAVMGVEVDNCTFSGSTLTATRTGHGLLARTAGTRMDLAVAGCTFLSNNVGLEVSASASSDVGCDIVDNLVFDGNRLSGINVFLTSSHSGWLTGTLSNNVIGVDGLMGSGASAGSGVQISQQGVGQAWMTLVTNTIQEVGNGAGAGFEGLFAVNGAGAGELRLTIADNVVRTIRDDRGLQIRQSSGGTTCVDLRGNLFSDIGGLSDIGLVESAGSLQVAQEEPTAASDPAELDDANGGATIDRSGAITFGLGACPDL